MTTTAEKPSTYNGWRNYETWAVKLWMDNEEPSYRYWRDRTREVYEDSAAERSFTKEERAAFTLADVRKAEHEESLPELAGFAADLLNAAFGEVDWYEIAQSLIGDMIEG